MADGTPFQELPIPQAVDEVRHYRHKLYGAPTQHPDRDSAWVESYHVPQSMQFMIECLPMIQRLLLQYPRNKVVEFADVGAATASGSNLVAELHQNNFLWCKVKVDAIDHIPIRQRYAQFRYPLVNYIVSDIFALPDEYQWDIVFCSATIEHIADPLPFINELKRRARDWVILYAPFEEWTLSLDHKITFTKEYIEGLRPESVEIVRSLGWNPLPEEDRSMFLAVLRGEATAGGGVSEHRPTDEVTQPSPAGVTMTANPNPVPVGSGTGTTTVTWSTGDGSLGSVRVAMDGGPEKPFSRGATGAQEVNWLSAGRRYEFRLYTGTDQASPLASVTVTTATELPARIYHRLFPTRENRNWAT